MQSAGVSATLGEEVAVAKGSLFPGTSQNSGLRTAIRQSGFGLAAQPIFAAEAAGGIYYQECLARLVNLDGTECATNDLISVVENAGAALALDSLVMSMVLDRLNVDRSTVLGCNLSATTFASPKSWRVILKQLERNPHLLPRLVIEITETREIPDFSYFAEVANDLRDLGCRIALDDFGTGFSSPRLLQLADFDIVKIDKAFLHDDRRCSDGHDSLWHMVKLASCFCDVVVVEGVENAGQMARACEAGATHLQGYLLARPCPIAKRHSPTMSTTPH